MTEEKIMTEETDMNDLVEQLAEAADELLVVLQMSTVLPDGELRQALSKAVDAWKASRSDSGL